MILLQLRINKSVAISHLARCLLAQALATDAALWITMIGVEAQAESEHMAEEEGTERKGFH